MKAADYIVKFLIEKGVTDVFGIPGGVMLEFLYAVDAKAPLIEAHLNYHEQSAAFAASGYAQVSNKIGVAYATKGPGFSNLITGMADAFYESNPVLFLTAHSSKSHNHKLRADLDQEMDTVSIVRNITKYAKRIDSVAELPSALREAYTNAMEGRRGPVFLDILASVFKDDICIDEASALGLVVHNDIVCGTCDITNKIESELLKASRPVVLIGDGINQSNTNNLMNKLIKKWQIPVISSRYSVDVIDDPYCYFGYIGSHGVRYANFILSKADLVIALGNRMSFPLESKSFSKVFDNKKVIRTDIDDSELSRKIPNSIDYLQDLRIILPELDQINIDKERYSSWMLVCDKIRTMLYSEDVNEPTMIIRDILKNKNCPDCVVCDVGNNEFWVSRASVLVQKAANRIIYSKSFGALGCGIGKAIGAFYATRKPVVLFVGDQGFQLNIQELQYIAINKISIVIVVINNNSSGMIRSRQLKREKFLHTTCESGYSSPSISDVASCFKITYLECNLQNIIFPKVTEPLIIEVKVKDSIDLTPSLPVGEPCQNMIPFLDRDLYDVIEKL